MIDFYVGQKVVCVDASDDFLSLLTEGAEYTIRWVGPFPERQAKLWNARGIGVMLAEIDRSLASEPKYEPAFRATRFRPLTDISVFTAMLTPAPTGTREAADA